MYFAFLDFYLKSLVLPAVICSLFLSSFTMSYAVFISLWGLCGLDENRHWRGCLTRKGLINRQRRGLVLSQKKSRY
jgi:hypothetical protein